MCRHPHFPRHFFRDGGTDWPLAGYATNGAAGHDKTPIKSASLSKWGTGSEKPAGPKQQVTTSNFPALEKN
jgi:hypothetical protein